MVLRVKKPRPSKYIFMCLQKHETAREILDRGKKKLFASKDKNAALSFREFPESESFDLNGNPVKTDSLIVVRDEFGKIGWANALCVKLEGSIGAPFLNKQNITNPYCDKLKLRTIDEIRSRLDKYKRKQSFELKMLQTICVRINSVQEPSTLFAVRTLNYLYNLGHGRTKRNIATKLQNLILDRERDKLFFMRRHPSQRMLHFCSNDSVLEQIKHLEWVFVDKHPFEGVKSNVTSHSKYV